ncbi:MAG: hypothetical protein ACOXZ0_01670 [Eubacteriales bacterium]|jgi:ribosomal-protein-alanine N-acetyltransferase
MQHLGIKQLETNRLILRRLVMEDALQVFQHWAKDAAVTRFLTRHPHKNVEESRQLL